MNKRTKKERTNENEWMNELRKERGKINDKRKDKVNK